MGKSLETLVQSNLIEKEATTGVFRVCPFIDYFVEMKINPESKEQLLKVISKYYELKLFEAKTFFF